MQHAGLLLLAFFFFQSTISWAQSRVKAIEFEGLGRTKASYVKQFVKTSVGDPVDSLMLEDDRQRLTNLEVFANAEVEVAYHEGEASITFRCQEVQTLLPLFNFGGVEENLWFLLGISEVNLGGRGNKFTAFYQYYDRSSVFTSLFLDRINQSRWGLLLNFVKWGTEEPLFFNDGTAYYDYDNYTYGAGAVYHLNFLSTIEFSTAYFTEEYNRVDDAPIEGAPQREKTYKQLVKLIHQHRQLDYHYFYLKGMSNTINAEAVFSYDGDEPFQIVFDDFRLFHRIGRLGNLGNRWRFGISTNRDSPFAPFVLDSFVNIRGVGNRVDRGTAMFIMNNEYRHAVLDWPKVAIQAVGFSDFGTWRSPGGDLSDLVDPDSFEWFAGGGVRLIHKEIFNAILRIDYGVDVLTPRRRGFVLGIGQYF